MTKSLDASIVLVSFNTRDHLRDCLASLRTECSALRAEVFVVDNDSADGSAEMVASEFPEVRLIRSDRNLGFAVANNRAFREARGRYITLVNPDARLQPGTLKCAVERMDSNPDVGLAGGRLIAPDGSPQPSARLFPSLANELLTLTGLAARYPGSRICGRFDRTWADPGEAAPVDWVPGAFAIIRRSVLDEVGYFDERFFLYYEEVDLCRRVRAAGYSVWYWPELTIVHVGGESSRTQKHLALSSAGSQLTLWRMRSALLYYRKHHGLRGAWAASGLEKAWHTIRARRNQGAGDPLAQAKREESELQVALLKQAWAETGGGQISPPHPW